jgi:hypothetical protein
MKEILEKYPEEIYEKPDNLIDNYVSQAKTERGLLLGLIQKFLKDAKKGKVYTPKELEIVFTGFLNKFNELEKIGIFKDNNYQLELQIISGWKGEGTTEVYRGFDNDFRVIQPLKNKTTGIVSKQAHTVKKEDLNRMIHLVHSLPLNEPVSCYEIAKRMGLDWKEDVWKNRTKVYFPKYYFPIKILEKLKIIQYGGDGNVTRKV